MLRVDEFESEFRRASKAKFRLKKPEVGSILIVSDLDGSERASYETATIELLGDLAEGATVHRAGAESFDSVETVVALVEGVSPDLVCSYRNLRTDAWRWRYSLGTYLSAMLRDPRYPVLITPSPHAAPTGQRRAKGSDRVMVVTDHLAGDDRLVNWGVALTDRGGELHLSHLEHDGVFDRYMDAISKIASIDTETARAEILEQLLREPTEYIGCCAQVLREAGVPLTVREHVGKGHRVADFRALVEEHQVDVLVVPTLEDDVLALHGVSYALAVELTEIPLLMA